MTFYVTYFAHPELLRICINSIRKFYPTEKIVVSQQVDDMEIPKDITGFELISHDMKKKSWADVAIGFMKNFPDDVGVFMEHDCVLLKPIENLVQKLGEFDLVGVEEVIPGLRNAGGYANQNFFILKVNDFVSKYGYDAVFVDVSKMNPKPHNVESAFGISQHSNKIFWLPVSRSGYAWGTFYGDYAHHMWYGSYRQRNTEQDGVTFWDMEDAVEKFINDYNNNELCSPNN